MRVQFPVRSTAEVACRDEGGDVERCVGVVGVDAMVSDVGDVGDVSVSALAVGVEVISMGDDSSPDSSAAKFSISVRTTSS